MTDLDFDELDKAVNSLMGGVKEKDPTAAPSKTLTISTTLAPDEEPSYNNLSQAAEKIGSEAIDRQENTVSLSGSPSDEPVLMLESPTAPVAPVAPVATPVTPSAPATSVIVPPRPTGRFMDVVHPSSDMRSAPPKSISREGVTIAAPGSLPKPAAQELARVVDEPAPADTSGNLPVSSAPTEIDESNESESSEAAAAGVQEPLTSPFLPDAKVEKRPLGGTASEEEVPVAAPAMGLPDEKKVDELEQKFPTTESVKEGSSIMDTMNEPVKSLEDVTEHVPEEYKDELLAVEKNISTEEALPAGPIGTASIPKQYQEKPSTGDESNGAIYDTTSYHKPLSHPAEKKSGWLWVVVIVIILILGAAGGAAAYLLGFI